MKLKGSLTTPTCGRFYGKKLNLVVLSQLVGFFNSLIIFVVCGTIPSIMVGLISDHSNDNSGTITLSLIFLCAIIGAFVGWNKGN